MYTKTALSFSIFRGEQSRLEGPPWEDMSDSESSLVCELSGRLKGICKDRYNQLYATDIINVSLRANLCECEGMRK